MDDADRVNLRAAWRAGTLLGGSRAAGRRAVEAIVVSGSQPKRVSAAQVLRAAAEAASEPACSEGDSAEGSELFAGMAGLVELPTSQRAAWLVVRQLSVPVLVVGKAFAMETPEIEAALAAGDRRVDAERGAAWARALAGMDAAMEADIEAGIASAEPGLRRRRLVAAIQLGALLICFGLLVYVMIDLLRWDDREAAMRAEMLRYSNPMPAEGAGSASPR